MNKECMVKSIIGKNEREMLYKILYIGVSAYNRLIVENVELVKSQAFKEIKTRLLNFVVKRQFDTDMIPVEFPFKVDFENVNAFNNIALFLNTDKAEIQVSKTSKARKLFNGTKPAKYMLREARINSKYSNEIKFFLDDNDEIGIKENTRVFMVIGYGIKGTEIDHLDFLIPENNMKECIDVYDALGEYKRFISNDINEEETESTIVEVKKSALQFVNNSGR